MGIGVIGATVAGAPQQFEQIIRSSTNWTVPAGVKTVDVLIAGGGGSGQCRGGFYKGIYNVQGKTSIPITIGARAETNGSRAGTTTFDGSIFATGGYYNGDTDFQNGNLIDLSIHTPNNITSGTPLTAKTAFSNGTTARFQYFAAFNGRGIAISSDGTTAMTTTNSGTTWTAVTSITGAAANFSSVTSNTEMLLHHNGGLWIVFRRSGTNFAYSTDGVAWVVVATSFGNQINDMITVGNSASRAVVAVTDSNFQRTSDVTSEAFTNVSGNRGDVLFRVGGDSNLVAWTGNSGNYRYSSNGGATWSTSSYGSLSFNNVNRWVKTYNATGTSLGVITQRGQNSNTFTVAARNNSADFYSWQSWSSIDTAGAGSTTSPNGSAGDNNTTTTNLHIFRPQTFNENDYGISAVWWKSSTRWYRTDTYNYSWMNFNDGTLSVNNTFTSPFLGGNNVFEVSEYVIGPSSPFRVIFTDFNQADGFIYRATGFQGYGAVSGGFQSGYTQQAPDAMGDYMWNSYSTTYPTNFRLYSSGEDGWGRTSGSMEGLGFGGANQHGAVRLRWWA